MKYLAKIIAAFAVATFAVGALAQTQGGQGGFGGQRGGGQRGQMRMMGGMGNPSMLVFRADVQDDLKLTSDQKDKLQALQDKMRADMRARFQTANGERPSREEMQAAMKKGMDELATSVNGILSPEQQTRVQQIFIQTAGKRSLNDPGVAKAVGLTEAEKTKVADLIKRENDATQSIWRDQSMSQEDKMAKVQKNNAALDAEIDKVITAAERAKLAELAGPKFTPAED
jgi:hypothetical protein